MENASKALIIAGAILISIVLISVGIMVVNGASDTTGEAIEQMGSQAIESFNKQFTSYEGLQRGSQVTALVDKVISNNTKYKDDDYKKIDIIIDASLNLTGVNDAKMDEGLTKFKSAASTIKQKIKTQSKYRIITDTDEDLGYVCSITIAKDGVEVVGDDDDDE